MFWWGQIKKINEYCQLEIDLYVQVCCPIQTNKIEFVEFNPQNETADDDYDFDYVEYDNGDEDDVPCDCKPASQCDVEDFLSRPKENCPCLYSSDPDSFVCKSAGGQNSGSFLQDPLKYGIIEPPKKLPKSDIISSGEFVSCDDMDAEKCKILVGQDPSACQIGHPSSYFMQNACMKSCNVCANKGCR